MTEEQTLPATRLTLWRSMGTANGDCRLLDAMFAALGSAQLTHELLVTLMAEVTAIVNARPIVLVPKKNQRRFMTGLPHVSQ